MNLPRVPWLAGWLAGPTPAGASRQGTRRPLA
jgi:hypothetical protein